MADYLTARCGSCNAQIIWAETRNLRKMTVDAEPSPNGDIQLRAREGLPPTAEVLPVAARFGKHELRLSHFVTCPNAAGHRRARPRARAS